MEDCNRLHLLTLEREGIRCEKKHQKGHKKGHENLPFWVLDGFTEIYATLLE